MKMTGEYALAAPRDDVWLALNDPEVLKECIPGCESIEKTSDTEMNAIAKMKVGPVSAKFKGKVTLSDLNPPNSYTITGEGSGGAAGFAKGGAKVELKDAPGGGTLLSYDVDAQVGGKIAQIGQRLVDQTAKKMADEFFTNFANKVGRSPLPTVIDEELVAAAGASAAAHVAGAAPAAPGNGPTTAPTASAKRDVPAAGLSITRWSAVILLVILVLVLVYYITS